MKDIIRRIMSPILGNIKFQWFFELLHKFSLVGMNMASDGNIENSGEKFALSYVYQKKEKNKNLILFDVGANVGSYSLTLNKIFDSAAIYSFEPSVKTFEKLKLNLNNLNNINIFNHGFSDKNLKSLLYSDRDESGLASLYKRRLKHFDIRTEQSEEVIIKH